MRRRRCCVVIIIRFGRLRSEELQIDAVRLLTISGDVVVHLLLCALLAAIPSLLSSTSNDRIGLSVAARCVCTRYDGRGGDFMPSWR